MKLRFVVDVEVKRKDKAQPKATRAAIDDMLGEHLAEFGASLNDLHPNGEVTYEVASWAVRSAGKGTP